MQPKKSIVSLIFSYTYLFLTVFFVVEIVCYDFFPYFDVIFEDKYQNYSFNIELLESQVWL